MKKNYGDWGNTGFGYRKGKAEIGRKGYPKEERYQKTCKYLAIAIVEVGLEGDGLFPPIDNQGHKIVAQTCATNS